MNQVWNYMHDYVKGLIVINERCRWCWMEWRHQAGEWTALNTEYEFLFIVAVLVAHRWFKDFGFHFDL